MRAVSVAIVCLLSSFLFAQEPGRFGVPLDAKSFPQETPQKALSSFVLAVKNNRVDYLVAHLADPAFIDARVKTLYAGQFAEQVADTKARLDPSSLKLLEQIAKDGDWKLADREAHLSLKAVEGRSVYFKKIGERWMIENKQAP